MPKWVHKLKDINISTKKALCHKCGIVDIWGKQRGGWRGFRCINRLKEDCIKKYKFSLPTKIITHGVCPICKKEKKLYIDHCHKRNIFRGFICSPCNKGLGFLRDNIKTFENAIEYLRK